MTITCLVFALLAAGMFFLGSITENCMTWAVRKRLFNGGRLLVRRSMFADKALTDDRKRGFNYWLAKQVPHFAWSDKDGLVWQYTVRKEWEDEWKAKSLFMVWLQLWFYDGLVVQGDPVFGDRI